MSRELRAYVAEIRRHVGPDARICEIGAGHGFLAAGLARLGFRHVDILEPNTTWTSGTGFVASRARELGVRIGNDIDAWYAADDTYDLVITRACVHHFDNVQKVAAEIARS